MRHLRFASLFVWAVVFAACAADDDVGGPASTSQELIAADPGAGSESAEPVDVAPEGTAALDRAGIACGPNGLFCSPKQECCSTDPLPPAPPRFFCAKKGTPCSP